MGFASPVHILLVVAVLALLFGVKRLPEIGRRLGTGVREIKDATGIDEFRSHVGELKESLGPGGLATPARSADAPVAAPARVEGASDAPPAAPPPPAPSSVAASPPESAPAPTEAS